MMRKKINGMHICKIGIYNKLLFHILSSTTIELPYFELNDIESKCLKIRFMKCNNNNKKTLSFGKDQDTKNSFLENLRHKYPAVRTSPLLDIINDSFMLKDILSINQA